MAKTLIQAGLAVLVACSAAAEPVLHEYVPPPGQQRSAPSEIKGLPASIKAGDETLPRPSLSLLREADERVLSASGARVDRVRPDRITTAPEGVLHYRAVFNPDIVPFKRMSAFDTVGASYELRVGRPALEPVPVAQVRPSPDRELFWGSLLLQLVPGQRVPIPSVAPEARILSYLTIPRVQLTFLRDGAGNFVVQAEHRGVLRLVFLTDAPRRYFTPTIPPAVTVRDVPSALQPTLPPAVREAAAHVLQQLEVDPAATLLQQLDRLTTYFRNFEAGTLPRHTSDTYLDIALSRKGVCRHRSLAFVVTAQALGIPARYVQNEAHAFVEVFVPRMGWARIDLGGAAANVRVDGAAANAMHRPRPDPFPRPSRYATATRRLEETLSRSHTTAQSARSGPRSAAASEERRDHSAPGEPAASETESEADATAPRAPTQLAVSTQARTVLRGHAMTVRGRILGPGGGAADLRIEIFLKREGQPDDVLLGTTVSGPDGRFIGSFPVPVTVQAGDYKVYATTLGDSRYQGSMSR